MGGTVAGGDQAVAGGQELDSTQEVEGAGGVAGVISPHQQATLGMLPRGSHLQPALCDPEDRSLLRNPVQTLTEGQPSRLQAGNSP